MDGHAGWCNSKALEQANITVETKQALRYITIGPANVSFEENKKGSIEPGKWTDLMTASPQEILNANIESTWISGEECF